MSRGKKARGFARGWRVLVRPGYLAIIATLVVEILCWRSDSTGALRELLRGAAALPLAIALYRLRPRTRSS